LLSSDLATLFTGRTMEIKVYPFSFMEYLTYYEITDGYDDAFDQYVRTGGMPGAYVYKTEDRQYDYVRDVYSTILVRDLVEKYKIRNKSEFTNISEFMMDNIGNLLSPNNISKTLNNDRSEITRKTVSKYIGYLENAFLFYEAKRYDLKGKKYLANNSKYYLCDSSFRYAVNGTRNMDFGRVYENIVYLELRRRGYEVYVGKLYKREVDFVAKKRETQIYIQVSDNISDEKTFEREHSPLLCNTLKEDQSMCGFVDLQKVGRRQDMGTYYRLNGAIYLQTTELLMSQGDLYGEHSYACVMSQEHSIDIDTALDFQIAETIMRASS